MYITEEIIKKKPFIQEALGKGIINYASYAEMIKPEIEKILKKEVKLSAIIMSLRRISETLEKKSFNNLKFDKEVDLTMRSDLFQIVLRRSKETEAILDKLELDLRYKDLFSIIKGTDEIDLVSNIKYREKVINSFSKKEIIKEYNNIGAITITISENIFEQAGFFYLLTKTLAWENISIVEIISTMSQLTFVLREEDLMLGFNSLKKVIDENRV